jgi:hypothetical protein
MAVPTYFTVVGDYLAITAAVAADLDVTSSGSVTATVVFVPKIKVGDVFLAVDATPRPLMIVPVSIVARIDTDGRLKLRSGPDRPVHTYANLGSFPGTGIVGDLYVATDTGLYYRWTGSAYVETVSYTQVRLLADTPLLGLSSPLFYSVTFLSVRFNDAPGVLNGFTFAAKTSDEELNLVTVARVTGTTQGALRGPPGRPVDDVQATVDGDAQFYVNGTPIGDPIPMPGSAGGNVSGGTP